MKVIEKKKPQSFREWLAMKWSQLNTKYLITIQIKKFPENLVGENNE